MQQIKSIVIFCSLLFFLFEKPVFAQMYSVSAYSVGEGLIQSQVGAIFQDKKGYLWLGTHRGVCRFDGHSFLPFPKDNSAAGLWIKTIIEDNLGNIWIGADKGLTWFDGGRFHLLPLAENDQSIEIRALFCDKKNTIWIGTKDAGLHKYQNGKVSAEQTAVPNEINKIVQNVLGDMYLGTNEGLFVRKQGETDFKVIAGTENVAIQDISLEGTNTCWLATQKGVWKYENQQVQNLSEQHSLANKIIHSICREKNGVIWFGTETGMLRYYKNNFSEFSANGWNQNNNVTATFYDREGNVWIGADGVGLFKVRSAIIQTYNTSNGLTNNIAKSFLEDKSGNIWLSTFAGINQLSENGIKSITTKEGLVGNDICYSFKDSKGNFWFATYSKGVSRYDGSRFYNLTAQTGLRTDVCYSIAEDQYKNIWIGTNNGIVVWDGTDFHYFTTNEGLSDNSVYAIYPDRRGYVWVGTANGLNCFKNFKEENQTTEHYSMSDGLSDNCILSIREDARGWIWLATRKGLSVWNEKKWEVIDMDKNASAAANDVVSMVFSSPYKLWVGTNNGVYRLDLARYYQDRTLHPEHFTTTDGLPNVECNANAAFQDSKGNVWMGTITGAACFPNDSTQYEKKLKPITHITNVRLFFRELTDWDIRPDSLDKNTQLPVNFSLTYNQNHLTFDFIGISHQNPAAVRYQFQLVGFDTAWQPVTSQTFATYNNLEPGKYTFLVRSSLDQIEWDEAKPFSFKIESPYWQKWWFILACILVVGAIGYLIWLSIQSRMKQKQEQQKMKDQAEMLQLEHQALYAMMNPHFTFNALQSIQYFIHSQDKLTATKFLGNFAKLVRMNLDSSKSEFISLKDEVERLKLYLSLEKMRFQDKFSYFIDLEDELDSPSTQIPPMILQPFVENSIKHGIMPLEKQGKIIVSILQKDEETLLVSIKDNGIGIEASKKMRADRPSDHVSKGMQITKDRLKLFANLTGKDYSVQIHELKNEAGEVEGTEVTIYLPMKG
ncbi:MAG: two-component regulator propeller domain-containing protein [Bacteroidia bacterium]